MQTQKLGEQEPSLAFVNGLIDVSALAKAIVDNIKAEPAESILPSEGYVDAKTFAAYLDISKSNLYAAIRRGQIADPVKIGKSSRWPVGYIRSLDLGGEAA